MNQYQNTSFGQVYVQDNTVNKLYSGGAGVAMGGNLQYYETPFNPNKDLQAFTKMQENTCNKPISKKEKKMAIDKNKRGLFQVILIDPKEKKMLLDKIVIADNIEDVLLEVDAGSVIKSAGLAVADVDKIVNIIGQIRKTRKNKNGEVEIINEEIKE